jgi:hypothetical protein
MNFLRKIFRFLDEPYDIDHVRGVLSLHDWQCVFELGAPQRIVERLSVRTQGQWLDGMARDRAVHEEFRRCFVLSEIYCPHEGIDRRAEYGIRPGALQ